MARHLLCVIAMLHELVVAMRSLVKRPAYSVAIVLTLALGIAAITVMFSLLDAAILRPLPFRDPEAIVTLTGVAGPERNPRGASFPEIADWRALNHTLQDVAIYDEISLNLRIGVEAVRVDAEMVSASYFKLLGADAALGRTFLPEEDTVADRNPVAVISHGLWMGRFGGARDILERTIELNGRTFSIVGVMPAEFGGVSFDSDVWIPSMMVTITSSPRVVTNRGTRWLLALGRLQDGTSLDRAREDLDRVAALLEQQHPSFNRQRGVQVDVLQQALVGHTRPLLISLFAAVVLFLAVACANVSSLQLVRSAARTRELAVRFALGARRWHVIRQLSIESMVLAVLAGALGVTLAAWALSAVFALMPEGALPAHVQPALGARAGAFALAVSLLAGIAASILPAMASTRRDLSAAMKEGARSAAPGLGSLRRPSTQQALVVAEVALAMTLLVAAGLMLRSLDRQMRVPLGFNPDGVTVARLSLPDVRYAPEARAMFVERLISALHATPLVQYAAVGTSLPFTGTSSASTLLPEGSGSEDAGRRYYRYFVTPEYIAALGLTLKAGRQFGEQDRADAPRVAMINESGARRIWGTEHAIGRRFHIGGAKGPLVEIVGIVADAKFRSLTVTETEPEVFFPFGQLTDRDLEIAVRTADNSPLPLTALQGAIGGIDGGLPAYAVQPLGAAVRQQTSTARFGSTLLALFSAGSLLLAAVGLYGLVAYVVSLSRREIAIRLALGAGSRRVAALIVGNGLALVMVGIAAGAAGAALAGRWLQAQLFETDAIDPLSIAGVAVLLISVACLACVIPARRAIRIDPHTALRLE